MADGKEKSVRGKGKHVRFDGKFGRFEYEGKAKKIYRNGENIIDTEVYCKGKRDLVERLTKAATISVLNSSAALAGEAHNIQDSPQRKFLLPVLENLASKDLLVENEASKVQLSVCPTMAANMELANVDFQPEIFVDSDFLKRIKTAGIGGYERAKGNMSEYGTARAPVHYDIRSPRREADDEKIIRSERKLERCKREVDLLNALTPEQRKLVKESLELLEEMESTWLVNIYKLASSTRSRELSVKYKEAEMSFESRGHAWYEIWRHPKLGVKIYESLKANLGELPGFIQDKLPNFARRVKDNRLLKTKPV